MFFLFVCIPVRLVIVGHVTSLTRDAAPVTANVRPCLDVHAHFVKLQFSPVHKSFPAHLALILFFLVVHVDIPSVFPKVVEVLSTVTTLLGWPVNISDVAVQPELALKFFAAFPTFQNVSIVFSTHVNLPLLNVLYWHSTDVTHEVLGTLGVKVFNVFLNTHFIFKGIVAVRTFNKVHVFYFHVSLLFVIALPSNLTLAGESLQSMG